MATDPLAPTRHLPVIDQGYRHHPVRAHTISIKRFSQRELRAGAAEYPEQPGRDYRRPATFADCERAGLGAEVPCPFVSCAHHLALDVDERSGSIKLNFPDLDPVDLVHTCALRVADRGGATLEDVGAALNLTRERVRQLEERTLQKLRDELGDDVVRELVEACEERHAAIDATRARYPATEPIVWNAARAARCAKPMPRIYTGAKR